VSQAGYGPGANNVHARGMQCSGPKNGIIKCGEPKNVIIKALVSYIMLASVNDDRTNNCGRQMQHNKPLSFAPTPVSETI